MAARRLVDAGVRFVTLSLGGWDTHDQNFNALRSGSLPQLDQTLSALIKDLSDRGTLDRTIVLLRGRVRPDAAHQPRRPRSLGSMSVVLAGGGFRRGSRTARPTAMACSRPSSRAPDDVSSTIFQSLGLDPHQELQTRGSADELFREGRVVPRLMA